MECFNCGREIRGDGILVNSDGDFCCSHECRSEYDDSKEFFFNEVIHDDNKFDAWMDSVPDKEIAAMKPVISHEDSILRRIDSVK